MMTRVLAAVTVANSTFGSAENDGLVRGTRTIHESRCILFFVSISQDWISIFIMNLSLTKYAVVSNKRVSHIVFAISFTIPRSRLRVRLRSALPIFSTVILELCLKLKKFFLCFFSNMSLMICGNIVCVTAAMRWDLMLTAAAFTLFT